MEMEDINIMTDKELAILFHDTYERLAPIYGYETREETKEFDPDSPNGQLMIAVCGEINKQLRIEKSKAISEFLFFK